MHDERYGGRYANRHGHRYEDRQEDRLAPWERSDYDDELHGWLVGEAAADDRLQHLVYVDGRLVDSWTTGVTGSRWERFAKRFDAERRPVPTPAPAPPPHQRVLAWLDGLVGGRAALLALTDSPAPPPKPPTFETPEQGAAFAEVSEQLDRVAALHFDREVSAVLDLAQHLAWQRRPTTFTPTRAPNAVAGGLVWVVGRANGLFAGGLRQQVIQRELWLKQPLSSVGRSLEPALRGISLITGDRPHGAPDLTGFAEPALLTPTTRRDLMRWRDVALGEVAETP